MVIIHRMLYHRINEISFIMWHVVLITKLTNLLSKEVNYYTDSMCEITTGKQYTDLTFINRIKLIIKINVQNKQISLCFPASKNDLEFI